MLGAEAVQDLVGEVEDAHPERDPLHVPGPHRDEEAVQVPPLALAHLGPGPADPGPGHVVSPPRETQHLPGECLNNVVEKLSSYVDGADNT